MRVVDSPLLFPIVGKKKHICSSEYIMGGMGHERLLLTSLYHSCF